MNEHKIRSVLPISQYVHDNDTQEEWKQKKILKTYKKLEVVDNSRRF